jgi:hypothetical protein
MLSHEGVCVLQRHDLPLLLPEVTLEELNCGGLFTIPASHPPQPLKNSLFLESKVKQATIYWVLQVTLRIFIPCDDLKLNFLRMMLAFRTPGLINLTKATASVIHINMPLSRACSQSIFP